MSTIHPFAQDNADYLEQALVLLEDVPDDLFAKPIPPMFESGLGAHLRHCLDHYAAFLDEWKTGRIDYDARARDPRLETDRSYAMEFISDLKSRLVDIREEDGAAGVEVKMDCGGADTEALIWSNSTVERELQFLISHTVHHYALIAVLLRLDGREPFEGFGVAPSTLRYRKQQQPCAP